MLRAFIHTTSTHACMCTHACMPTCIHAHSYMHVHSNMRSSPFSSGPDCACGMHVGCMWNACGMHVQVSQVKCKRIINTK